MSKRKQPATTGQLVASFRKRAGLRQDEAAARAEITQSYWSYIESDKKDPSLPTLKSIAVALGVSARDLLPK